MSRSRSRSVDLKTEKLLDLDRTRPTGGMTKHDSNTPTGDRDTVRSDLHEGFLFIPPRHTVRITYGVVLKRGGERISRGFGLRRDCVKIILLAANASNVDLDHASAQVGVVNHLPLE